MVDIKKMTTLADPRLPSLNLATLVYTLHLADSSKSAISKVHYNIPKTCMLNRSPVPEKQ